MLLPTPSASGALAVPLVTGVNPPVPPTRTPIVAFACVTVGVTVMVSVRCPTAAMYDVVPLTNAGLSVPALSVSALSDASVLVVVNVPTGE